MVGYWCDDKDFWVVVLCGDVVFEMNEIIKWLVLNDVFLYWNLDIVD